MEHKASVVPRLTWVPLAAAVLSPDAESVAVIVAVAPVGAPH
jgi:ABC-type nitrate/sulfonate/bicarbonate transport system permease component